MVLRVKNYRAIIDINGNRLDRIADQRAMTESDPNLKPDARRAALTALDTQAADLTVEIDEARAMLDAENRRKAAEDQSRRGHIMAAASALPGEGEARTAARVEVRHNEPLPEGRSFADLTDKPASFREFGDAMRALAYGNPTEVRTSGEGTDSAGGFLVAPRYAAGVLDLARAKTQVVTAGATVTPLDSNDVTLAKVTGDPSPAWRTEHSAIQTSDLTFGAVKFNAKSLAVLVKASWELIEDAENFGQVLAESLAAKFAVVLDHAALYGSGVDPEPNGLINQVTNTLDYPLAGIGSYDPLIEAVAAVRMSNHTPTAAIMGEGAYADLAGIKDSQGNYVVPPAYLKDVAMLPTTSIDLEGDGSLFVGDWRNLHIGIRTGFEVKVLNERFADTGEVGFIGWLRADVQNARSDAFAIAQPAAA